MNYDHIHRYDTVRPVQPGSYEVRFFLSGPWLPVSFDGVVWRFLNGDVVPDGIILLWMKA